MKVAVVLATYNGMPYLTELINSIPEYLDIIVSDDCSSDGSVEYLSSLKRNIVFMSLAKKYGSAKANFSSAINRLPDYDYDYFFFADQDDVWRPGKAEILIAKITDLENLYGKDTPCLSFSDATVVDNDLNLIHNSFIGYECLDISSLSDYKSLVLQNVAQGASMIVNKCLINRATLIPSEIVMHDWWLILVASLFGHVSYSPESTLLYRQHSNNQVGAKAFNFSRVLSKILFKRGEIRKSIIDTMRQSGAIASKYEGVLTESEYLFLTEFSSLNKRSLFRRKVFCLKYRLKKSSFLRTLGFYLFV